MRAPVAERAHADSKTHYKNQKHCKVMKHTARESSHPSAGLEKRENDEVGDWRGEH